MMKKEKIMPVLVLAVICLVVALLLAGVNMLTRGRIDRANNAVIIESLETVMPDGDFGDNPESEKIGADAPETVKAVYTDKAGNGKVVILVTNKGYTGKEIGLSVAIDKDGKIIKMVITKNEESIIPADMRPLGTYGEAYAGVNSDEVMELETGATVKYSEGAIKSAIFDAFVYLGYADVKPELPREESEIESLAKTLYGEGAKNLKSSTPEESEYVKRIYQEEGKSSYVAYAFAYSRYGTPEFEFLVYVDESGNIKAMEKILWKVSDANPEWGYNPPSEERVNEFFGSFVGKNSSTVSSVDVATGATNTATGVRDAVTEALGFFRPSIPRDVSEILTLAKSIYTNPSADLQCTELEGNDYARLMFKEKGADSYIVYSLNYSRYGTPEFEMLIYVNESGSVEKVEKILWKVSDAKPEWGYNPPSEERVNEFFGSFVGKNSSTVSSVDVATGATNTATGVRDAVSEALGFYRPSIPREVSEILELAKSIYKNPSADLEYTYLDGYDYARLLFREKGANSYIIYSLNYSRYGTPEFEMLTYVDGAGNVKATKKILWKVSDAKPDWGYNPPSDERVDELFAAFVGKNADTVSTVDVASGATNTASGVRDAVSEALGVPVEREVTYTARVVGIVILSVALVVVVATIIIYKKRREEV